MSSQSIRLQSQQRIQQEVEENLFYDFENYFLNKNFKIGGVADRAEANHNYYLYKLLCTDNCEIVNYIQDKIDGKLECKNKPKKKKLSNYLKNLREQELLYNIDTRNFWEESLW